MFKNLKIARKLIFTFIMAVAVASIGGVVGLVLLNKVDKNYSTALVENGFVLADIGNYNTYLNQGTALVRDIIMLTDQNEIQEATNELENIKIKTQEALDAAKMNCKTAAEKELISQIDAALPEYTAARDKAVELGLQNKNAEALEVFKNETTPPLNECVQAGQELMTLNVKMGNELSAELTTQSRTGMMMMLVIMLISAGVGILLALVVSKMISRPVQACADRLSLLASGDLHTAVAPAESKDETGVMLDSLKETIEFLQNLIGDIGAALGKMAQGNLNVTSNIEYIGDFTQLKQSMDIIVGALNETLGQINQASDQVSDGSDQVSAGAQALSQGATEQASSVEELAATINEISQQVKSNARNAEDASKKSYLAGEEVVDSNQKMKELITAMDEISNSSKEIGKVIKTIEDIAFQTNILALNAAVEAARAGTAGKGFAVVADEVRNLASKSAEAAKSTTALIEGAVKAVENGTNLADDTAQSLNTVVESAQEIATLVDKISKASNDQAQSIGQVTQGIDQISSVVQTNSATAEESAASSEELSGQAQVLKGLVGKFKLKDDAASAMQSVQQTGRPGSAGSYEEEPVMQKHITSGRNSQKPVSRPGSSIKGNFDKY